jgi:hypothetical protein
MSVRATMLIVILVLGFVALEGASVSKQQADSLVRKMTLIEEHGSAPARTSPASPRRTSLSEGEVNSWFAYHATPLLPKGISEPRLTIVDSRRVVGVATVDLDAIAKSRASGRTFDIWNLIGGRVPVTVTGFVHADGGRARFEMESAEISGIPVPRRVVEELVDYYSRTPERPKGVRLADEFTLPARIQDIELSPGSAVVVQ